MHSNFQRLPAERARHKKRLPLQGHADAHPLAKRAFSLTGTILITETLPLDPTTTANAATTTSTSSLTSQAIPTESTDSANVTTSTLTTLTPTLSFVPAPVASASAINPSPSTATEGAANAKGASEVSSQHVLPTGAIVGITIACVMLVLGAFVFFIRQRAIRNRQTRRQTTGGWAEPRPTNSSFEAREVATVATYPATTPGNMGETSPGVSFARAQAQALAARVPVPDMPQPMPSSYNNPVPAAVPITGAATASVRYEFIPTLPDELSINTGEVVRVLSEYDDGWALCANLRGEQGMVPLECLERTGAPNSQLQAEQQNARNSRRTSSLMRY
ncbi:hypothetical protein DFH07DRAFT_952902 [Mycena maculata]|uniref:SH3 domain-containing protein n=1 Tax=Mycena maculata TaxID=230809 RepID=A0AAD7JYB5_9AGAR|nr:hypothetical protein DFH07DRAFT_952902 [Mycena maculata]